MLAHPLCPGKREREDYHWMEVMVRNARGRFTTYYVSPSRRAAK
jgi:hypothetical protein